MALDSPANQGEGWALVPGTPDTHHAYKCPAVSSMEDGTGTISKIPLLESAKLQEAPRLLSWNAAVEWAQRAWMSSHCLQVAAFINFNLHPWAAEGATSHVDLQG